MADEQFHTTSNSYHDIEQIMQHLCAQDSELLRHTKILEHLLEKNGISLLQIEAELGNADQLEAYKEKLSADASATDAKDEKENP